MSNGPGSALSSLPVSELRQIAQPPQHSPSPTDVIYRRCSIYLSVPLAKLGLTPNQITIGWIVIGVLGVVFLLSRSQSVRIIAAVVLEFSYLLDFVDGEVARLTDRKSMVGSLLDLMGHALIKTALPLAIAGSVFLRIGSQRILVAGAIGAVALSVGDSLRFHATSVSRRPALGDLDLRPRHGHRLGQVPFPKLAATAFQMTFESPGLFGCTLAAAALNQLEALSLYWAIFGSGWMLSRAIEYVRRIRNLETGTKTY